MIKFDEALKMKAQVYALKLYCNVNAKLLCEFDSRILSERLRELSLLVNPLIFPFT